MKSRLAGWGNVVASQYCVNSLLMEGRYSRVVRSRLTLVASPVSTLPGTDDCIQRGVEMKRIPVSLLIIFSFFALSACGRNSDNEPASADEAVGNVSQANSDQPASNPDSVSALARSYEGALPPTNQLILGILELEDTDDAVTAAQASTMLPLWQALRVAQFRISRRELPSCAKSKVRLPIRRSTRSAPCN